MIIQKQFTRIADPLTPQQRTKIERFVRSRLTPQSCGGEVAYERIAYVLRKPYRSPDLAAAAKKMLGNRFTELQSALANVDHFAKDFDILPESTSQRYVALKCLKAALSQDTFDIEEAYCKKLRIDGASKLPIIHSIIARNQRLADRIDHHRPKSIVAILAAHVYVQKDFSTLGLQDLHELVCHAQIRHLMLSLATLFLHEKGQIIVGDASVWEDQWGRPFVSTIRASYNGNHTIIVLETAAHDTKTYLAHDIAHFVICRLSGSCDPTHLVTRQHIVNGLSEREQCELDKVLATDRAHQQSLDPTTWATSAQVVYELLRVDHKCEHYFGLHGFDPTNPDHLRTMRCEQVVRLQYFCCNDNVKEDFLCEAIPSFWAWYKAHNEMESKRLNDILESDREWRKNISVESLNKELTLALETISSAESETYFAGKPDFANPAHLQIMRIEYIVSIPQMYAHNISAETIQRIAPRLHKYYQEQVRPAIEELTKALPINIEKDVDEVFLGEADLYPGELLTRVKDNF